MGKKLVRLEDTHLMNSGTSFYVHIPMWFLKIHGLWQGDIVKRSVEGDRLILEFEKAPKEEEEVPVTVDRS